LPLAKGLCNDSVGCDTQRQQRFGNGMHEAGRSADKMGALGVAEQYLIEQRAVNLPVYNILPVQSVGWPGAHRKDHIKIRVYFFYFQQFIQERDVILVPATI